MNTKPENTQLSKDIHQAIFLLMTQHTPAAGLQMKITYDQFVVLQNGLQRSQLGLDKRKGAKKVANSLI